MYLRNSNKPDRVSRNLFIYGLNESLLPCSNYGYELIIISDEDKDASHNLHFLLNLKYKRFLIWT